MARYKPYDYSQGKLIPVFFKDQILPGTVEYALNHIADNELDLSIFLSRYKNDQVGASAFDPAILLKIILFIYSHGITSSRKIEACCQSNILFKALSADTQPHFITLADFISTMEKKITLLFRNVLLICDEMGLIGKEMFAIDGCKLSSNASKEWSGTHEEFAKKKAVRIGLCPSERGAWGIGSEASRPPHRRLDKTIEDILKKHRAEDGRVSEGLVGGETEKHLSNLRKKLEKIRGWLCENGDKMGKNGQAKKSNITDNESAKMATSHGVIQGYNGVASVDAKHQVIVHGEAYGEGSEHKLLKPMIDGAEENFKAINRDGPMSQETKIVADNGYYTKGNMKMLEEEKIDGYVPDNLFRKRDARFATADRHKQLMKKESKRKYFAPSDFKRDENGKVICSAGNALYLKSSYFEVKGLAGVSYMGRETGCRECSMRSRCLRNTNTVARQMTFFTGRTQEIKREVNATSRMIEKVDGERGREIYSHRMGIVGPVFGNIRSTKRLSRFGVRGRRKVNTQWLLFCMMHNIGKIQRYGMQAG